MKRRGRPVLGAISGLLLGVFAAVDLSMFGIAAPSTLTVIVLPVGLFVLGIILGRTAPFGRSRG
jgi:hypothetical protein